MRRYYLDPYTEGINWCNGSDEKFEIIVPSNPKYNDAKSKLRIFEEENKVEKEK